MRFVFKKHSQSEDILNDYQRQIKTSYIPAYTGSLGIVLAIAGPLYAGTLSSPIGQQDTRLAFLASGITLAVGSYIYGQWAIHKKEKTLEKAIDTYNDAVAEPERIRVQISPLPTGDGGEIKTQVPLPF